VEKKARRKAFNLDGIVVAGWIGGLIAGGNGYFGAVDGRWIHIPED
jgi:hypothetical protein